MIACTKKLFVHNLHYTTFGHCFACIAVVIKTQFFLEKFPGAGEKKKIVRKILRLLDFVI
jgi:hypothetical protein